MLVSDTGSSFLFLSLSRPAFIPCPQTPNPTRGPLSCSRSSGSMLRPWTFRATAPRRAWRQLWEDSVVSIQRGGLIVETFKMVPLILGNPYSPYSQLEVVTVCCWCRIITFQQRAKSNSKAPNIQRDQM